MVSHHAAKKLTKKKLQNQVIVFKIQFLLHIIFFIQPHLFLCSNRISFVREVKNKKGRLLSAIVHILAVKSEK